MKGHTKCLHVPGGNDVDGTAVQLWQCDRLKQNQQFEQISGTLRWRGHNKCLGVANTTDNANHVNLQIWSCGSSPQPNVLFAFASGVLRAAL